MQVEIYICINCVLPVDVLSHMSRFVFVSHFSMANRIAGILKCGPTFWMAPCRCCDDGHLNFDCKICSAAQCRVRPINSRRHCCRVFSWSLDHAIFAPSHMYALLYMQAFANCYCCQQFLYHIRSKFAYVCKYWNIDIIYSFVPWCIPSAFVQHSKSHWNWIQFENVQNSFEHVWVVLMSFNLQHAEWVWFWLSHWLQ